MEIKLNLSKYFRKEDDPLFKDGKLYLYTDTKSEDYPDEVVNTFADNLIDYYCLHSLDKIAERMNKFKLHSLNVEINNHLSISFAEIDRYVYVYEEYDMYTDTKIELTEEQKECNVLCGEFNKLFDRVCDVIHRKTGFGYSVDYSFDNTPHLFIKPSRYAAFFLQAGYNRHININEYGYNTVLSVWLKDKDGEFFLPSFTIPEVEYEYLAPMPEIYGVYADDSVPYTVKPGRNSYVNTFHDHFDIANYLRSIGYTDEYMISVTDISDADLSKYVLTNHYISRELIKPLSDDNSVKTNATDSNVIVHSVNKLVKYTNSIEEDTRSDYIDVFISLGVQTKISYELPRNPVFTDKNIFTKIKESIKYTFSLGDGEYIFNRKGKPIDIDEVLANVTEEEFFDNFRYKFYNKRVGEERRLISVTLNNGCVVHYKLSPFGANDVFECFKGKHINVKNIRPFKFDKEQKSVYLLNNMREKEYFVKVEKNESGLKIPSFKGCSQFFLTAEDCEKYLEETIKNGVDTSGIYFVKLDLDGGYIRDYYKDVTTGKLYSDYTEMEYVTPIPMDIKF